MSQAMQRVTQGIEIIYIDCARTGVETDTCGALGIRFIFNPPVKQIR